MESYKKALHEFESNGISGFWKFFGSPDDAEVYLQKIKDLQVKEKLSEGLVPASIYWLVDGDEWIGHVSIRHELNPALERLGGNIGYAIRSSKQNQGYGSRLLELALPLAKKLGICKALITCDKDNAASLKIIKKNGGKMFEEDFVDGREILRFWISLS